MVQAEEVRNGKVCLPVETEKTEEDSRLCLHPDSVHIHVHLLVPSPEPITSGEDTEKEDVIPGQGFLLREYCRRNSTGRGEQGSWDGWCTEGRPPAGGEAGVEP